MIFTNNIYGFLITVTVQNGRPLEIEDKANLTLLIYKYK